MLVLPKDNHHLKELALLNEGRLDVLTSEVEYELSFLIESEIIFN